LADCTCKQTNKQTKQIKTNKHANKQEREKKKKANTKINDGCKIRNNEFGQSLQACQH
jgi:hypothetical protein